MNKKNLIIAAAVAGMISGTTAMTSAQAEDAKKAPKAKAAKADAKMKKGKHGCNGKMKDKEKEMGCKAGQCGSKMDEKAPTTPEAQTPPTTPTPDAAAPAPAPTEK